MLRDSEVILFCQTTNGERAKAFYGDTLGLKFQGEDPFALAFSTGRCPATSAEDENRIFTSRLDKIRTKINLGPLVCAPNEVRCAKQKRT